FRQTVQNSFVFTAIALTLKAVLGVWLALLLARRVRFKRLIRGAVLLPWVIPTALSTLGWWWMFDSLYSVVNWTAIRLGIIAARGARDHHAPLRDARLSGRAQRGQPRPGCGHLALPLPAAGGRGLLPAPVHPEGVTVATARGRGAKLRSAAFSYANLLPFVFF